MKFNTLDIITVLLYTILIVGIGLFASRKKKGKERSSEDYFLASKSLPWWAIGASLIAANISAEQFIGMSGSGFVIGLGIASYEWMSALTLVIVAKFFLPLLLKKRIFTLPQYLENRYDKRVKMVMSVFWLLVYVFVNLTSVLYLGSLALQMISGIDLIYGIIALAFISALYSVTGGLKAVVWTDVIQVAFLVGGGILTTIIALDTIGNGNGVIAGFAELLNKAPEKFDMILSPEHPYYQHLPGLGVLIGGMWIANLSYWGLNQYIIQRALAAPDLREAQKGLLFAGFLKLLIPLIVVLPGICAFVLKAGISKPDEAYPWLVDSFIHPGLKGLIFAALAAAIVSSLSSMVNSTATIFTMDIYRAYRKNASESELVKTGRITGIIALITAILIAPQLRTLDQVFQYIQEFTGFITPGVLVIFGAGMFWKGATARAALITAILSIPLSFLLKVMMPDMAFLNRMGVVFILLMLVIIALSLTENKRALNRDFFNQDLSYSTTKGFNIGAIAIIVILTFLYIIFW